MPAKNSIKISVENTYYHIYNRGVEKRKIFCDEQDNKVFLSYLKTYLSPPPNVSDIKQSFTLQGSTFQGVPHLLNNFFENIHLIAYCLMPNHFHLLIKQIKKGSMESFMKSLSTRYSIYFNKKYDRVGPLFQGIYKAVMVLNENYLLHLSRYIHLNPVELGLGITDAYSSYPDYLGLRNTSWIKHNVVTSLFSKDKTGQSYKNFVEDYLDDEDRDLLLEGIAID